MWKKVDRMGIVAICPSDLPDFDNPPVVETLLAVQFEPLAKMRAAHFGLFWRQIQDRFPKTDERPPLSATFEAFPEPIRPSVGLRLEALENPQIPRFWFTNASGTELMQAQTDRFIKNWRKVGEGDEYPRYERVREAFEKDFRLFEEFIAKQGLGAVVVNQCEITYVNHIVAGEGWDAHSELDKVFRVWNSPSDQIPGPAADVALQARFVIANDCGEPVGRLHVSIQPAKRADDGRPMFVFNLTARGLLGRGTDFFDLGRARIVRSFAALTTAEMHKIWRRKN